MTTAGGIAAGQLKALVIRIEKLEEHKKELSDDIRDVYAEAKANGFDTKTIRQVVKLRGMDRAQRAEEEALLDLYLHALDMLPGDESPEEPEADRPAAETDDDAETRVTIEAGGRRVETTVDAVKAAADRAEAGARPIEPDIAAVKAAADRAEQPPGATG